MPDSNRMEGPPDSSDPLMENRAKVQASVGDVESLPPLFKLIAECGGERGQLIAEALDAIRKLDEKTEPPLDLPVMGEEAASEDDEMEDSEDDKMKDRLTELVEAEVEAFEKLAAATQVLAEADHTLAAAIAEVTWKPTGSLESWCRRLIVEHHHAAIDVAVAIGDIRRCRLDRALFHPVEMELKAKVKFETEIAVDKWPDDPEASAMWRDIARVPK